LNFDDAVDYCQSNSGWLPYAIELTQICDDFDLRPGIDSIGRVRVADVKDDGHKNWHDKGFHFSSPECGDVSYDFCGTQRMNSDCEWGEGLYGDDQEVGFVCLRYSGYILPTECQDGIDNDNDFYTDYPDDPSCDSPGADSEAPFDPGRTECSNGFDDDNDGAEDYPEDFSCGSLEDTNEVIPKAKCQDLFDNDGDGEIDYPADSDCESLQDNSEKGTPGAFLDAVLDFMKQIISAGCAEGDVDNGDGTCTATFFSSGGDGSVSVTAADWNVAHYASSGTALYGGTVSYISGSYSPTQYSIYRTFLPFDTSRLEDDVEILDASLRFTTGPLIINEDDDGNDFIVLVQTSQISPDSLIAEDYDNCGSVDYPIEGSDRIDISDLLSNTDYEIDLTQPLWIQEDGWTLLGLREGHDVANNVPDGRSWLTVRTSESGNPSELKVVYVP